MEKELKNVIEDIIRVTETHNKSVKKIIKLKVEQAFILGQLKENNPLFSDDCVKTAKIKNCIKTKTY